MKKVFNYLWAVFALLLITFNVQAQSVFRIAAPDNPGAESVSGANAIIGGQIGLTLAPDDKPLEEGLLYHGQFIKPVYGSADGRFQLPVVTRFNLDDFNIIDVFDEDGITAAAAPYYLLSTTEAPWILHGALTGSFDVRLAKPGLVKGFVGIEKTIPNIIEGLNGSAGVNMHWGDAGRGTSFEGLVTVPMSKGSYILLRLTNAYYTGQGRQTALQVGLAANAVN